jgi:hypothetical protein
MTPFWKFARYSRWLGRECWALRRKSKTKYVVKHCRVIAVSWKGAVCVRDYDDDSGRNGEWIDKKRVPTSVWWRLKDVPKEVTE